MQGRALLAALALAGAAGWLAAGASAQSVIPAYTYVRDSGGQLWFVGKDAGVRAAVPIHPATDEDIAAIPSTGQWLVPKPDGSGLTGGPRPSWDTTGQPPPPPAEPVKISGTESQNSRPFNLAGSYAVTWRAERGDRGGGNFIVTLRPIEGATGRDLLVNTIVPRDERAKSGETQVYNLPAARYYLDVTAPGDWSVTFSPP